MSIMLIIIIMIAKMDNIYKIQKNIKINDVKTVKTLIWWYTKVWQILETMTGIYKYRDDIFKTQ